MILPWPLAATVGTLSGAEVEPLGDADRCRLAVGGPLAGALEPRLRHLYGRFADDLRGVIEEVERIAAGSHDGGGAMRAQFDDLESELLYLTIRDEHPVNLTEISPCDGWSTLWILSALRDNGDGVLQSFDRHGRSRDFVPRHLRRGRWNFYLGDVRERPERLHSIIDLLLIDSSHRAAFAHWYTDHVFPRVADDAPVMIHDIVHPLAWVPRSEGGVVRGFLRAAGVEAESFSQWSPGGRAAAAILRQVRADHGLPDHRVAARMNPSVFFRMPVASRGARGDGQADR